MILTTRQLLFYFKNDIILLALPARVPKRYSSVGGKAVAFLLLLFGRTRRTCIKFNVDTDYDNLHLHIHLKLQYVLYSDLPRRR